jgi:HPt (histidine-containing phosphotransfer) domain-containing protein
MSTFEIIINKMIKETCISKDKAIEFYELFLNSYSKAVMAIELTLSNEDYLLKLFHKLKGSAFNLRLDDLGKMISAMEQRVKEGNFKKCYEIIEASLDIINEFEIGLNEYKGLM